jgi:HlyD family secretion protein
MKRYRWLNVVGIAAAVVLLAGCQAVDVKAVYQQAQALVQGWLTRVEEKDQPLTASGTIQADEVRIASELGGRIVQVTVRQGDAIRAEDVLIRLDDTSLQTRLLEAEAAVAVEQANLEQVKAGPRDEQIAAARAALALAQAERDGAEWAWENALDALRNPQDLDAQIVEAQTKVKLAEQGVALAEAQLAKEKLIRDQKSRGSIERDAADWQVKAAEEELAAAQADLETAQTMVDGLWAIRSRPLALIAQAHLAEGQYQAAEAGVQVAQARLDDLLAGPTAEEIAVAEGMVRVEQAKADAIRSQQLKFVLTSPVDGIVLDQALRPGELAAPAATILTVADLSWLKLTVYVPVDQVGHVQLEQQVQIAADSFPGRVFIGHVSRIGDEPEYTPRNIATKEERINTYYAVEIKVDNTEGSLKPGMPADATF